MGMFDLFAEAAISKEEGSEPRPLTKSEKEAALKLLDTYYCDPREALEDFLDEYKIIPDKVKGKTILTKELLKDFEDISRYANGDQYCLWAKAEYIQTLIGEDYDSIVERIEKGKCEKRSSEIQYSEADLREAIRQRDEAEDLLDRENENNLTYRRNSDTSIFEVSYKQAYEKVKEIQACLSCGKGAIEIYNENNKTKENDDTHSK